MNIKIEIISALSKASNKKVIESTKVSDLGIDSLDLMDLIMKAEEKIGAELNDDVITNLKEKTVKDIIEELEKISK